MVALSDVLGAEVRSADGTRLGKLVDVTIDVDDEEATLARLAIGHRRQIAGWVPWSEVVSFERGDVRVTGPLVPVEGAPGREHLGPTELLVARDVLDVQIVDVAEKRIARAADVVLQRDGDRVRVVGVEVGAAGLWRRLGLRWLAARTADQVVAWPDLHLTSGRGHALHLAAPHLPIHRLTPEEVAALVVRLPPRRAARVLHALRPTVRRAAVATKPPRHPRFRGIRRRVHRNGSKSAP